jgi:hypothetical protein
MTGISINGTNYIRLMHNNELKNASLEDNIYFTLRDIFWNGDCDMANAANHYNSLLTINISFEQSRMNIKYSDILHDKNSNYTQLLYNWIKRFSKFKNHIFDFEEVNDSANINMNDYMKYDDWWEQYLELLKKLEYLLKSR